MIGLIDLHLMGRNTYDEMSEFWPGSDDPYAQPMNEIVKSVFSETLAGAGWPGTEIVRGDLLPAIAELKAGEGKDILAWGGAAFAQSLVRQGLVDEFRLIQQPVALGQGLLLFKRLERPLRLELVGSRVYTGGATLVIYRPLETAASDQLKSEERNGTSKRSEGSAGEAREPGRPHA